MTWLALMLPVFAVIGGAALPAALRFLRQHGMTAPNYAGDIIPVGSGAVVALLIGLFGTVAELLRLHPFGFAPFADPPSYIRGDMASLMLVFAIGWLDDCVGDKSAKGMRGHLRKWRETGTPSTGIVKAAAAAVAALWVVIPDSGGLAGKMFDGLTIVLATNAMNLLDVRPGRAWKCFFIGAGIVVLGDPTMTGSLWLIPAAAGGIALMRGDLRGVHMLGDSGSNLLGFVLGRSLAYAAPDWLQAAALAVLVAMHWTAERGSISAWIERHKWVRWLDRFGRV